jgi:hypothetical protein
MIATATAEIVTHAMIPGGIVDFEQSFATADGEALTLGWSEYRNTVEALREYGTYGLWRNGTPRMFALDNGVWFELCRRCGGTGNWGYGPDNGRCFKCWGDGRGVEIGTEAELTRRMKSWGTSCRTASRKAEAEYNARQAEIAAWRAENAEMIAWATALVPSETAEDGTEWCNQYGRKAGCFIRDIRDGITLDKGPTAYLTKVMINTREENNTTCFIGTEGSKITITGTVTTATLTESDFGSNNLIIVTGTGTDEGAVVKFFSTAKAAWDAEAGDNVTVTGTVRKHEEYRGTRQTVIRLGRGGLITL